MSENTIINTIRGTPKLERKWDNLTREQKLALISQLTDKSTEAETLKIIRKVRKTV